MGLREIFDTDVGTSRLGGVYLSGEIDRSEFLAGKSYAVLMHRYLRTIDAPEPFGSVPDRYSDEHCLSLKLAAAEARHCLRRIGRRVEMITDKVVIYDEEIGPDEVPLLRLGLRALAGTLPAQEEAASSEEASKQDALHAGPDTFWDKAVLVWATRRRRA